mmetsp:Transcript_149109/g.271371  ORF Transcript_149109/g.271371 Transcript_149109/m.271371 type:complete len:114 (-) Transcript_149109:922-1263(-)
MICHQSDASRTETMLCGGVPSSAPRHVLLHHGNANQLKLRARWLENLPKESDVPATCEESQFALQLRHPVNHRQTGPLHGILHEDLAAVARHSIRRSTGIDYGLHVKAVQMRI